MAHPSTTTTFSGHQNEGLQVGHNSGSIHVAAPERRETPPRPACFVPFRRDPDFVDRGTLLDKIREQCAAPASRVALVGLGGVGKSQLAIEHCYRTAEQSPNTWVFWAHASNAARLEQSFREIADQVKIRGRQDPQADVFKLVHDWLRDTKHGRWLLVLDNADDAAVLSPTGRGSTLQQHLTSYLPPSRHGSVLVTSRTKSAAMQVLEESEIIPIESMHDAAAHALLRKKLRGTGENDGSIAELATTLDHMPLALAQAAAHIRERAPRCSVQQYLEEYRQSDHSKTSLLNREAGNLRRDRAASNSVLITWQITFDHIRKTRQSAADLLSLMSFFDRQGIQEALLRRKRSRKSERVRPVRSDDGFEDDILALRDYSLIKLTRDTSTFEMHSLVQLATRTWLGSEGQLERWRQRFIANLCAELPRGDYEEWEKCQTLFPHARAALSERPKDQESLEEWALLLYNAAWYAWNQGRADEAEQMAVISMEVRSEFLGEEHPEVLNSMEMVGLSRRLMGKYEEAEAMYRRVLAGRRQVLGHEHAGTLTILDNLAVVLRVQGKYIEAEAMHRQTLAISKEVRGHKSPETLACMDNLGSVLRSLGKYDEAEGLHRQTLAIREKTLGNEHPDTLTSIHHLASVLRRQGKYDKAEAMQRQTLAMSEKALGHEHPDTLHTLHNLALVLYRQDKHEEAEAMYKQALARTEKVLGHEHPETLKTITCLAELFAVQRRYTEAFALYERAYAGFEVMLGRNHPDT
ncbi:P-loop containing nucleoside triphosphate hydrolase protein, partial [Paraphoma chrysanthemicola]